MRETFARACLGPSSPEAPAGVLGVPVAPDREIRAVEAGCLDEPCVGKGLASPEPQRISSEPSLYYTEAIGSDALLHLGEISLAWGLLSR